MKRTTKLKKQIEGYKISMERCKRNKEAYSVVYDAISSKLDSIMIEIRCSGDLDLNEGETEELEELYDSVSEIGEYYKHGIEDFDNRIEKYNGLIKEAQTELKMLG